MGPDEAVRAVRSRFDDRAPSYDESAMHRELALAVAQFVDLTRVEGVLDVATGTGLVLRALRDRSPSGLRMIGVDISPGMLAVARRSLPEAAFVEADARSLPLTDASVDLLTCVTALHLIPDTAIALDEWSRVLRPGGSAVTATFMSFGTTSPHPVAHPTGHGPFSTPAALGRAAAESGLRLARHERWSDGHDVVLIAELERL